MAHKERHPMTHNKLALSTAFALMATAISAPAHAQSTDGYHSIQVFPVVVDSASFTQRFTLRNPDPTQALAIAPTFYPGDGASQATKIDCPAINVPAATSVSIASLRALCPTLGAGSQFGYLYLSENGPLNLPFAGFSRAANAAGIGFSVEAFPAHTFTSADAVVTGLRRSSATASSPAFQSNCFIGNLNEVTPAGVDIPTTVDYTLTDSSGAEIGAASVILSPGKLTRLIDVFAAAGAPAGNYVDASIRFEELGSGEPGLMTFCTVQDNSSFGADFRIAKQEQGFSTPYSSIGAQDDHVSRNSQVESDVTVAGDVAPRAFSVPAGAFSNTHVVYFRHPDYVQCEVIDPATNERVLPAYGLEMRLSDQDGATVAGGNNATGFAEVYLGDKQDRNDGANTRYTLQVESSGLNALVARPYRLHCQSGSGHTLGDIIRYQSAGVSF
jgi:hypothetical protein